MKKIAITPRLITNESYFEIRDALDIRWAKLFEMLNFLPIILPTHYNKINSFFDSIDIGGIILTSGNDLYSVNQNELSNKRDIFEKNLIKYAVKNNIPLLGLCRGFQIIAEYYGCKVEKCKEHVGVEHSLHISDESRFKNDLSKIKKIRCYHNYSIKKINNNFIISARSEDGVIEAFEHKDNNIFAQMWHSEREEPLDKYKLKIIKEFFK